MAEFKYQEPFPIENDTTVYRLLTKDYVKTIECEGRKILKIEREGLELLAREAYADVSFYLRAAHLQKLADILKDPEASDNDKFVAHTMLMNQVVSAEGELPTCQDTGTAICIGKKGENVWTGINDAEAISKGVFETYRDRNLRYSQVVPFTMTEEKNTGTNLPAQIDLYATQGNKYEFLFITKGGGSANKTFLYQQTKALLNEETLTKFIQQKVLDLGTSACPPYHLAVVIGGTSAEACLTTVKKASAGYYDHLPTSGNEGGRAFRDLEWEEKILKICRDKGIGAQFGGKYWVHDVRVIRLPRHAASCPVGIGVSCSADRNIKGRRDFPRTTREESGTFSAGRKSCFNSGGQYRPRSTDGKRIERTEQISGENPFEPIRDPDRCPGHRPCPDQTNDRRRQTDARIFQKTSGLLCRSCQNSERHGIR